MSPKPITTLPKDTEPIFRVLKNKIKNLSHTNIKQGVNALVTAFVGSVIPKVTKEISRIYERARNSVASSEGTRLPITESDKKEIEQFTKSKLLWQSYSNLSDDLSKKINKILENHFEGNEFDYAGAKKELLKELPSLSKERVNRIIRTEYANVQRLSMEKTYKDLDPKGEWRYKWLSIPDNRRTKYCYNISKRTIQGVTLKELKQIIREEADPKVYTPERPFMPHINCRSTFVRIPNQKQ